MAAEQAGAAARLEQTGLHATGLYTRVPDHDMPSTMCSQQSRSSLLPWHAATGATAPQLRIARRAAHSRGPGQVSGSSSYQCRPCRQHAIRSALDCRTSADMLPSWDTTACSWHARLAFCSSSAARHALARR